MADFAALQALLTGCASPTTVELTANISATDSELTVPCVVELDLAGFDLEVRNIVIETGQQLTIDDSNDTDGTLTANAPSNRVGFVELLRAGDAVAMRVS